jgi:hypothetical protein
MNKILKKVPGIHRRGFLYEEKEKRKERKMKKYQVLWWEEHIIRKEVEIEAVDEWEAQEKAMSQDFPHDTEIHTELHDVTDSDHIKTTLIKE